MAASDVGTGLTSAPCSIAQFLVGPAPALPPPTGLATGAVTSSSVALTWNAVSGAAGYKVYRNNAKANAVPLTGLSYADSGLAAVDGGGAEIALSGAVSATTASGGSCSATNASNYAHVQAGRAHDSGGDALANGPNQNMGLDNLFYASTLAQTSAGYYIIGTCP